ISVSNISSSCGKIFLMCSPPSSVTISKLQIEEQGMGGGTVLSSLTCMFEPLRFINLKHYYPRFLGEVGQRLSARQDQ
ncbi:hypothetical protein FRX31_025551, partial [Thalictrum thalictroides]